jgi:hypothetical protein
MMTKKSVKSHQVMNSTHMLGMMKASAKAEAIPEPLRSQGDRDIITAHAREKAILNAEMSEVEPVEVTGAKAKPVEPMTPQAPVVPVKHSAPVEVEVKKHPAWKKPMVKKAKHGKR